MEAASITGDWEARGLLRRAGTAIEVRIPAAAGSAAEAAYDVDP